MFCSVDLDQTRKTSPRLSAALSAIINEACTIWKALFWGLRFTSWGIYQLEISEHRSNSFSHECSLRGLRNSMKKCWSMVMNDACFNEQRLANERICSNDKFAFMSSRQFAIKWMQTIRSTAIVLFYYSSHARIFTLRTFHVLEWRIWRKLELFLVLLLSTRFTSKLICIATITGIIAKKL